MKKLNQIIFISLLFVLSFGQAFGEEYWQCEKIEGSGSLFFNDESSCDISSNPPYKQCKTGTCKKIDTEGSWVCTGLNAQTDIYFIGDEAGCKNFQEANPLKCNCAKEGAGVNIVPVDLLPNSTREDRPNGYKLLAPIGDFDFVSYDSKSDNFVGNYLSIIFKLAIGIISALAVIMLIVAGIQYMGEDSIFGKTKAKNQMTNAILGLLIALGSYAILYTISPDLIGDKGLSIKKISIELPDSGDDSVDPNCKEGGGAYGTLVAVNSNITGAVNKIKEGWKIDSFEISSSKNKFIVVLNKNGEKSRHETDMSPGSNGYAEAGGGEVGDKRTPKGEWKIVSVNTEENGKPVYSQSCSNMGASFWLLDPKQDDGKYRGIGIHGNQSGGLKTTNGCIRLANSDILALLPYVKSGISVKIN
ncbi:MAG TPA: L,D-transpeptidase family protein [Candidatus Paceibacterota bacterium]|nr:L,D-transpeptidase family protein [Candidatus Paceibacterota bacterium]